MDLSSPASWIDILTETMLDFIPFAAVLTLCSMSLSVFNDEKIIGLNR